VATLNRDGIAKYVMVPSGPAAINRLIS
jgi:hypothetical protein